MEPFMMLNCTSALPTDLAAPKQSFPNRKVIGQRVDFRDLSLLRAGTAEQPVLKKKGDDLRIDWGFVFIAAAHEQGAMQSISTWDQAQKEFMSNTKNPRIRMDGSEKV